jgi:hypothetical protein
MLGKPEFYRMLTEDSDLARSSALSTRSIKGGWATSNVAHRFSTDARRAKDGGWSPIKPLHPQTRCRSAEETIGNYPALY